MEKLCYLRMGQLLRWAKVQHHKAANWTYFYSSTFTSEVFVSVVLVLRHQCGERKHVCNKQAGSSEHSGLLTHKEDVGRRRCRSNIKLVWTDMRCCHQFQDSIWFFTLKWKKISHCEDDCQRLSSRWDRRSGTITRSLFYCSITIDERLNVTTGKT